MHSVLKETLRDDDPKNRTAVPTNITNSTIVVQNSSTQVQVSKNPALTNLASKLPVELALYILSKNQCSNGETKNVQKLMKFEKFKQNSQDSVIIETQSSKYDSI